MPVIRLGRLWNALMLTALFAATPAAFAQPPIEQQMALAGPPYVAIEQRLSTDQMHATGLDQLRPEQLSLLNRLLREQQDYVAAESAAAARDRKKQEATQSVTSTLKGEFRGWETGAVLELANGQRWRVTGTDYYSRRHVPDPKVTIEPGAFGSWYLKVDGTNASTKVKRIEP